MLWARVAFSTAWPRLVADATPLPWIPRDSTETKTNLLLEGLLLESALLLVLEALLLELLLRRERVGVVERTAIRFPGNGARRGKKT
jgi:hypothetical protein